MCIRITNLISCAEAFEAWLCSLWARIIPGMHTRVRYTTEIYWLPVVQTLTNPAMSSCQSNNSLS
jgi:hypothetical protein